MYEVIKSLDPRAPGIVLPMFYFKEDFKTAHPNVWKHIEEEFNKGELNKYGIRHLDDDWDAPGGICRITFMVNRLGVLFTNKKLKIDKYDIDINDYQRMLYEKVLRERLNIPELVNECVGETYFGSLDPTCA